MTLISNKVLRIFHQVSTTWKISVWIQFNLTKLLRNDSIDNSYLSFITRSSASKKQRKADIH